MANLWYIEKVIFQKFSLLEKIHEESEINKKMFETTIFGLIDFNFLL